MGTNATYEAVKDHVSRFRLEDFAEYIKDWQDSPEGMPECVQRAIEDDLMGRAQLCARLLDKAKGINPFEEPKSGPRPYGTQNHRSYTYKIRKALGYSYP